MYLCGVNKVRTTGYFIVYDFFSDRFKTILNTLDDKFCSNGVVVYNNSADCVSYQNDFLKITNTDINNDGLLDIVFSGNALIYCKGLETGYGKLDRPPQEKIKLNIVFIAHQSGSTPNWTLVDSTFCNKIKY